MPNLASAEQRHLFSGDLSRAQERDRFGSVPLLNRFHAIYKRAQSLVPTDRGQTVMNVAQQRGRRAVRRIEHCECFPTFRACHPLIHGIAQVRRQPDGLATLQMNIEGTTRRTKAAHHDGRRVRTQSFRHKAQLASASGELEFARQGAAAIDESRQSKTRRCRRRSHQRIPPGIRGAATAAKNKYRSSNSPARDVPHNSNVATPS